MKKIPRIWKNRTILKKFLKKAVALDKRHKKLTESQIAWCAGLFEGEGCISSHKYGSKTYPRLTIRMSDGDVVKKVRRFMGGLVYGPTIPKYGLGKKPLFVWQLYDQGSVWPGLRLLYKHLGKRRKARAKDMLKILNKTVKPTWDGL